MLSPVSRLVDPSICTPFVPPLRPPALPTGIGALDACLPGRGWPQGGLIELIQGRRTQRLSKQAVWPLLLPALRQLQSNDRTGGGAANGWVAWVGDVGLSPFAPSLAQQGLDMQRFIWVAPKADAMMDAAWAAEQLLRCAAVRAVVLHGMPPTPQTTAALRRLHYSAQANDTCLWVIRPPEAAQQTSPAVLRLQWCDADDAGLPVGLRVLKSAGPPTAQQVTVPQANPALQQALQAAQAMRRWRREQETFETSARQRERNNAVVGQQSSALAA